MSRDESFLNADMRDIFKHTIFVGHPVGEQYHDLEHQTEVVTLGMWLFLATEIMFFGTLFLTLGIYRYLYAVPFEKASERLTWEIGSINTLVLLVSSLMMVLAVHYARLGNRHRLMSFLLLTALLGVTFLALKSYEYYIDYTENLIPGWKFNEAQWIAQEGLSPGQVPHVKLFLLMYWIMTVTHFVHMTIGIGAVLILFVLAQRNRFSSGNYVAVDAIGLYWHFVDIVWIFLLPMLYLQGTHH